MQIGPYNSQEMVLCSADAGPGSQRNYPEQAKDFFPGAKWVGALRNAADNLSCDFLILTTQHGLVEPHQIITPYDMHIHDYRQEVTEKWHETIPLIIRGSRYRLMIFYSGGCPRDEMIEIMWPILNENRVALLTFGRPNMFDIGKVDKIWRLLMKGTTEEEIKSILKKPERFKLYTVDDLATKDETGDMDYIDLEDILDA
jgi:hypothetical protein